VLSSPRLGIEAAIAAYRQHGNPGAATGAATTGAAALGRTEPM
jgi:hypothetical protein